MSIQHPRATQLVMVFDWVSLRDGNGELDDKQRIVWSYMMAHLFSVQWGKSNIRVNILFFPIWYEHRADILCRKFTLPKAVPVQRHQNKTHTTLRWTSKCCQSSLHKTVINAEEECWTCPLVHLTFLAGRDVQVQKKVFGLTSLSCQSVYKCHFYDSVSRCLWSLQHNQCHSV